MSSCVRAMLSVSDTSASQIDDSRRTISKKDLSSEPYKKKISKSGLSGAGSFCSLF